MSLDELTSDVTETAGDIGESREVSLDRETRTELAMLSAALEPDELDELLRRGVHSVFQATVETGKLDFHLREKYDVTYDEYLSGVTFDEMTGGGIGGVNSGDPDDRRYQF